MLLCYSQAEYFLFFCKNQKCEGIHVKKHHQTTYHRLLQRFIQEIFFG